MNNLFGNLLKSRSIYQSSTKSTRIHASTESEVFASYEELSLFHPELAFRFNGTLFYFYHLDHCFYC